MSGENDLAVQPAESAPANVTETNAAQPAESAPAPEIIQESVKPEVRTVPVSEVIAQRKKRQEAEKEAAYWRGKAEATVQITPPPVLKLENPDTLESPKQDDFETWEEYEAAKDTYLIKKAKHEIREEQKQLSENQTRVSKEEAFNQRLQQEALKDPDIADALSDTTLPISTQMVEILRESDLSTQLLKYFVNNRDEAARISRLTPMQVAREIGRLEEKISFVPTKTEPQRVSLAPEPIQTVTSTGTVLQDDDQLPIEEYVKRRNQLQFKRK